MQQKIAIRKKALINRKKKYFEISSQFFKPVIELLKKKKKIPQTLFHFIIHRTMKLMY